MARVYKRYTPRGCYATLVGMTRLGRYDKESTHACRSGVDASKTRRGSIFDGSVHRRT